MTPIRQERVKVVLLSAKTVEVLCYLYETVMTGVIFGHFFCFIC